MTFDFSDMEQFWLIAFVCWTNIDKNRFDFTLPAILSVDPPLVGNGRVRNCSEALVFPVSQPSPGGPSKPRDSHEQENE